MIKLKNTLCLFGALSLAGGAQAVETLRVADSLAAKHFMSKNLIQAWMERVTELTNGGVKFQYFPSEQMGKAKDLLALTQAGTVDIAYIGSSYHLDKLPLSSVGEMPGAYSTSCEGSKAYWKLMQPGGIVDSAEVSKMGVKTILVTSFGPYQLATAKKPITNVGSLKGMTIRSTGGTKNLFLEKLGASPVSVPAPEIREALTRGTVDGGLGAFASYLPYGLGYPVQKYSTAGVNFGSFIAIYMINSARWDRLSPELQKAMAQAAEEIMPKACAATDKLNRDEEAILAKGGMKIVKFSDSDRGVMNEAAKAVGAEWAEHLDKTGKPGTNVLNAFRQALAEK